MRKFTVDESGATIVDAEGLRKVGIIMNGVTGRMGSIQHLRRSILGIRNEGLITADGVDILPDPVLVGRNPTKLAALAKSYKGLRWTTDLDAELAKPENEIYFDAQTTDLRYESVKKAIAAGKHVYCEKPTGTNLDQALELYKLAAEAGVKHGVVQDKLFLPGLIKLRWLIDSGFFGRILSVRGEFGYWVFTGEYGEALQRPSWNYRKEDGGGIILDMLAHWRYVLDGLFGEVRSVSCLGATHIPERWDESGRRYEVTADDSAYATFELASGVIAHFNSSWAVRVRRDDLLTLQVDGTEGSAVAGLTECRIQHAGSTPKAVWNPDAFIEVPEERERKRYLNQWSEMPERNQRQNAFRAQWARFLKHVVSDEPFPWDLREGAKGVQLAELGIESWKKRAWVDVPALPVYGGH